MNAATWNRERGLLALSVWQPYAWFTSAGIKLIENRTWPPGSQLVPGDDVAIHATVKEPSSQDYRSTYLRAKAAGFSESDGTGVPAGMLFPWEVWRSNYCALGAIVAVVRFEGVVRAADELPPSQRPFFFGEVKGNIGWRWSNVRQLREPIPAKGAQGLWRVGPREEQRLYSVLSGGQNPHVSPENWPWRRTAP